jgi:hypothetical protein
VSLYSLLAPNGPTGFGYGSTAERVTEGLDLAGRTVLVTGVNSGLGQEAMRVLALRGAHVIGTARTEQKAREACAGVTGKATGVACELSDPRSVRAAVATVRGMGCGSTRSSRTPGSWRCPPARWRSGGSCSCSRTTWATSCS